MTDTTITEIRTAALRAAVDWADDHATHGHNHLPEGAILSVASKFAHWIETGDGPQPRTLTPADTIPLDAAVAVSGERGPTTPSPADLAARVLTRTKTH
ncbi:hypothetical protein [Tsukamurella sp. 1534]|uniref:hypothetical protein n=1 Tax=Tsukamurella sp. 1534 TaxID=1151061 RepID=UPI0002D672C6|nr:hypothetical protein [Tsukamurella sp. 1534]